ncbi:MAG: MtrB/PioB family outer membrane beta-barrel protein, partial [Desulfuromonadaceae bacterium]
VTLGADAHAGYVTVAVEQLFRRFREKSATPLGNFGSFPAFPGSNGWDAGPYPHDDTPDSRLTATTVKVSTSPSGGLVAAAAFTMGRKENLADLGPYIESVDADTNFTKSCADVTYIPHPKLTLNFRYRMLDQDSNIPSQLTLLQATPQTVPVRESIDLERASYFAKASYRPSNRLTLMAEYERKDIHRSQTGPAAAVQYDPYWELPEDETINRYRISFINRPLGTSKLRINGWYELLTSDDPAYGVSVEDRQQVFAGVNWTPSKTFGLTSNLRLKKGRNSDFQGLAAEIDRSQWEQNFTFGLWSQPVEIVSLALNYGFMNAKIAQDTVYGTAEPDLVYDSHSEYRQRVHTTTLTLSVRLTEKIRVHAEGRHIRSHSKFDPEFSPQIIDPAYGILVDSSGLGDLSELEIIQSGVGLGLDWAINEEWSCSAKFSHDDYEDRHSNAFDGTVQMYMFNIARSW